MWRWFEPKRKSRSQLNGFFYAHDIIGAAGWIIVLIQFVDSEFAEASVAFASEALSIAWGIFASVVDALVPRSWTRRSFNLSTMLEVKRILLTDFSITSKSPLLGFGFSSRKSLTADSAFGLPAAWFIKSVIAESDAGR